MRHLERIKVEISNSSMIPIGQSISTGQRNALASVCGTMKVKLDKYVSMLAQNEAFTIGSLLDPSMKLRLVDHGSRNRILSNVRTIMCWDMRLEKLSKSLSKIMIAVEGVESKHSTSLKHQE